jgi:DNA-binding MarR family transcriptional regulator
MSAEHVDFEVSYKELERAAVAVLDSAERDPAVSWLRELGQHVEHVIDGADLDAVARWSAWLDRLAANLPAGGAQSAPADGYLTAMRHQLDRAATTLAQRRDVEQRHEIATGVRHRVLALVAERPRIRSGEIAQALDIAPSQASRALRELQRRGQVFLAEADPSDHDQRVHRYMAASAVHAATAA